MKKGRKQKRRQKQRPVVKPANRPLERFGHDGARVWWGQYWSHDVTLARVWGSAEYQVWIDAQLVGEQATWNDAQNLAVRSLK
jgi:hypothetical protein